MHLALFDLDETLVDGDCSELWNAWMIERGWIDDAARFLAESRAMQADYHAGRLKLEAYLALTLAPLAGRRVAEVEPEVGRFVAAEVVPRLFPQARECVAGHQARGDTLMLISASSRHLVGPVAEHLGVPHVIAVEPGVIDGRYTGATQGVLSYRGGKVKRLTAWLAERRLTPARTTFYSDSRNDLPLLTRVDEPVAVNPDPVLAEVARAEGWTRLDWRAARRHDGDAMHLAVSC